MQDVDDLTHYMNLAAELRGQIRQWEPVIEAAKAYAAVYGDQGASGLNVHGALLRSVKALEKEEE